MHTIQIAGVSAFLHPRAFMMSLMMCARWHTGGIHLLVAQGGRGTHDGRLQALVCLRGRGISKLKLKLKCTILKLKLAVEFLHGSARVISRHSCVARYLPRAD